MRLRAPLLLALGLVVLACGGPAVPATDAAAEELCRAQAAAVIDSGKCDGYQDVDDCPDFVRAMESCP